MKCKRCVESVTSINGDMLKWQERGKLLKVVISFYLSSFPQAHSQLTETHNRMCKGFDQHDQSILSESEDREISEQHF